MYQKRLLLRFSGKTIHIMLMIFYFFVTGILQAQQIDILLKGGHVIDPKNKIDEQMDVAITNGKIFQVAKNISPHQAKKLIDVTGLYVTPGIIDMHVHAFNGTDVDAYIANGLTSLPPDGFTFRAGVTTVVDAGLRWRRNFRLFKKQTIDRSQPGSLHY
jgi:dihydroorotase